MIDPILLLVTHSPDLVDRGKRIELSNTYSTVGSAGSDLSLRADPLGTQAAIRLNDDHKIVLRARIGTELYVEDEPVAATTQTECGTSIRLAYVRMVATRASKLHEFIYEMTRSDTLLPAFNAKHLGDRLMWQRRKFLHGHQTVVLFDVLAAHALSGILRYNLLARFARIANRKFDSGTYRVADTMFAIFVAATVAQANAMIGEFQNEVADVFSASLSLSVASTEVPQAFSFDEVLSSLKDMLKH